MMERRQFLALLAAAPVLGKIPVREAGRVETVFKSPGPYPNGLQATDAGLWIIDGEDARAHLVSYRDGTVLRGFDTKAVHPSGITYDGEAIWVASTYSREIIRADAFSGKTLAKHFTPGAGVIYKMPSDPPGRRSPVGPSPGACRRNSRPRPAASRDRRSRPGVAEGQAVGGGAAVPHDLPHRPRKLDRRAALPHRRQPPPRHRLGRRHPLGAPTPTSTPSSSTIPHPARSSRRSSSPTTTRSPTE